MPLGRSPAHLRDAIRAQLDSGFSGIRLPAALIAANPDILDLLDNAGAFPLVVGEKGLHLAAALLADFLDRNTKNLVIGGHFAGPTDPTVLDTDPQIRRLFANPAFHVAVTRHGALGHLPLEPWARAVIARIGWTRVLWGSEWPVALWRDESYRSTLDWVLRLDPPEAALQAIRHDNAKRLLFSNDTAPARQLAPEWDLMPLRRQADVWLFPPSLNVAEQRHRALMLAYRAWGGERRGKYSEFILQMAEQGITTALPRP